MATTIKLLSMAFSQSQIVERLEKHLPIYVEHYAKLYLYGLSRQPINENNHWEYEIAEWTKDMYDWVTNLKPGKKKLSANVLARHLSQEFRNISVHIRHFYDMPSYRKVKPFFTRSIPNRDRARDLAADVYDSDAYLLKMAQDLLACDNERGAAKLSERWIADLLKARDGMND